ncbi:hypothetical protein K502DRAFT_328512 [Neoconidiobolus thromboides FSU 785]|nr:hypothetical protein K502DRAFT_328512 [Neoconidiobolus thromboides FSU 785]
MEKLNLLIKKKESLENELKGYEAILRENKVGLEGSLVDIEGFPRADIDIPTHLLKVLGGRNDLKEIMDEIEKALVDYHKESSDIKEESFRELSPFAEVNKVSVNSPGYKAGLRSGDLITKFHTVVKTDDKPLQQLPGVLKENEEKKIQIHILRGSYKAIRRPMVLTLTPTKNWGDEVNSSLLGCHILPYDKE